MNILITGAWQGAQNHIKEIEDMGHKTCFMQWEKDHLPCEVDWVEGIICNGLFLHHEIEQFINLRYIQITSAGYDRVPMDYVAKHKIEIHNARGVYSIPMAEFSIAGVLQLYKKLPQLRDKQKQHIWEKERNLLELYGRKVCIVGMGSVGQECARRFEAFGCKIAGVDIGDDLEAGLKDADIVVLTVPYTEDTYHLIDEKQLKSASKSAIWVNISRGSIIDEKSLICHLKKDGKEGGAVLDVFEEEPLVEDSPLWDMENVIVTPHNSFVGENNDDRLDKVIIGNLDNCNA